jgi:hypothetical protein
VPVKITNVPKTIADCFKYRHKMGLDVAMEALQETWNANAFRWMNFGTTVRFAGCKTSCAPTWKDSHHADRSAG